LTPLGTLVRAEADRLPVLVISIEPFVNPPTE